MSHAVVAEAAVAAVRLLHVEDDAALEARVVAAAGTLEFLDLEAIV